MFPNLLLLTKIVMIINYIPEGWEVIFQKSHGFLAMQIARQWPIFLDKRWDELLLAIAEHDDSQHGFSDRNYLNENGTPKDFTFNELSLYQPSKVVESATYVSRFTTLLISMHLTNLYEKYRHVNEDTAAFLDEQKTKQEKIILSMGLDKEIADKAYSIFHWCDRCSLILCKNEIPTRERKLEICKDISGETSFIFTAENEIHVEPWPFNISSFTVYVEARILRQLSFKDDQELMQKLETADIFDKEWTFTKQLA